MFLRWGALKSGRRANIWPCSNMEAATVTPPPEPTPDQIGASHCGTVWDQIVTCKDQMKRPKNYLKKDFIHDKKRIPPWTKMFSDESWFSFRSSDSPFSHSGRIHLYFQPCSETTVSFSNIWYTWKWIIEPVLCMKFSFFIYTSFFL